ncbi:MAG TPA: hypothetical protein VFM18_22555 [Methanosarcina sp.]|nr:hypothetical protein [Methanosarcina sp.]
MEIFDKLDLTIDEYAVSCELIDRFIFECYGISVSTSGLFDSPAELLNLSLICNINHRHMSFFSPQQHYIEFGIGIEYMIAYRVNGDALGAFRNGVYSMLYMIARTYFNLKETDSDS